MISSSNQPIVKRPSPLFLFHTVWHQPMLGLFMFLVLFHFMEHVLQLYQFAVLG